MRRTIVLLALAAACRPSASPAQPPPGPATIALRPAAEPRPALKYRLVPEGNTLVPGNAAVFYHRGIQLTIQRRILFSGAEKGDPAAGPGTAEERIARWVSGPIAEVPRDEARKLLETFRQPLNEVELGSARSFCDWELDRRTEGISLVLPELQEMRSLARLVALRARVAILDGKTDEAWHWIETGLVIARHVSQGPTVIQALIGTAIEYVMTSCLEELIQVPGTPSLFWALADRPRPFIDMRPSLEGERYILEKEVPGLRELDRGPWSLDQARTFADGLQRMLFALASGAPIPGTDAAIPTTLPETVRRIGIAAMSFKIYPEARRALIAAGRPEAQVEAMPVVQVAALYSYQEYQRFRDDNYKWMNLPYWQFSNRLDPAGMRTMEQQLANPLLTMFRLLSPALNSIRLAALRAERRLDALQCVEAIRLHAAAHGGELPASLESISEAPTPVDPATGKPFDYKADGGTATLSAPVPPGAPNHPAYAIRYVLKLTR